MGLDNLTLIYKCSSISIKQTISFFETVQPLDALAFLICFIVELFIYSEKLSLKDFGQAF